MPFKTKEARREHAIKNRDRLRIARNEWRLKNIEHCREVDRNRDRKDYNPQWRLAHPELVKARKSKWNSDNPEKLRAMKRRYYHDNREKLLAKTKAKYHADPKSWYAKVRKWKAKNPDKEKAYQKKWNSENKSQIASRMKHYNSKRYSESPEVFRARAVSWYRKNKDKMRIKRKSVSVHRAAMLRQYSNKRIERISLGTKSADERQIVELIFNLRSCKETKCFYCGDDLFEKPIHIDHIMPISKGGKHEVSNLCASCPSCNLSKNDKTVEEWNQWKTTTGILVEQH